MLIPAARVGRVIGSRGAVIQVLAEIYAEIFAEVCSFAMNHDVITCHQGLRLETGASIDLFKKGDGSAVITLGGSDAATRAARAAIERIVLAGPI